MIIDENSCIEARHVIPALHLGLTQSLLFLYTSCKTRRTYGVNNFSPYDYDDYQENIQEEGPSTPGGGNRRKDWKKVDYQKLTLKIEEFITCEQGELTPTVDTDVGLKQERYIYDYDDMTCNTSI
ncbi:hypothetical protein M8J77_021908 [Diaphorina citri]|nr:hypothetical protein M8J77_021908 [Diaphorina citri]